MNNQGFTLVEIVITLAIGAIVSLAIGKSFLDYFKSYGQITTTQIQTMALNGVNEIVNDSVEDAMALSIRPGDYVLQEGEYGIYADADGDLIRSDSEGNVMTMFASQTGSINILNLFVEKDAKLDQLRFKYVYTDGTSEILSRTLTTQLFNVGEVIYLGNDYNGDANTFMLENTSGANILVFTGPSLSADDNLSVLANYLSDPSYTPVADPQDYFYGMVYWDETDGEYKVFNNRTHIAYIDAEHGAVEQNLSEVPLYSDFFSPDTLSLLDPDLYDRAGVSPNLKVEEGVIVIYDGKYYMRIHATIGNNGVDDPDNFKSTIGDRWVEIDPAKYFETDLSSERISSTTLKFYPDSTIKIGDIVYINTKVNGSLLSGLYEYTTSGYVEIAMPYNSAGLNLIVPKNGISPSEVLDFDSELDVPYALGTYVVCYSDTGETNIYKKVIDIGTVATDPSIPAQRLSGGWQLQSNQYDPYSCYVAGNQALVFGDDNDEIYVIEFTKLSTSIDRETMNSAIVNCYKNNLDSVDGDGYRLTKYVF